MDHALWMICDHCPFCLQYAVRPKNHNTKRKSKRTNEGRHAACHRSARPAARYHITMFRRDNQLPFTDYWSLAPLRKTKAEALRRCRERLGFCYFCCIFTFVNVCLKRRRFVAVNHKPEHTTYVHTTNKRHEEQTCGYVNCRGEPEVVGSQRSTNRQRLPWWHHLEHPVDINTHEGGTWKASIGLFFFYLWFPHSACLLKMDKEMSDGSGACTPEQISKSVMSRGDSVGT